MFLHTLGRELPQVDGSFRLILLKNSLDDFLRRKYAADPQFGSIMTVFQPVPKQ